MIGPQPGGAGGSGSATASYLRRSNGCTLGAVNTRILIFGSAKDSRGSGITRIASANDGDGYQVSAAGIYRVVVSFYHNGGAGGSVQIRSGPALENTVGGGQSSIRAYHNPLGAGAFSVTAEILCAANDLIWVVADSIAINVALPELYQIQISGPY